MFVSDQQKNLEQKKKEFFTKFEKLQKSNFSNKYSEQKEQSDIGSVFTFQGSTNNDSFCNKNNYENSHKKDTKKMSPDYKRYLEQKVHANNIDFKKVNVTKSQNQQKDQNFQVNLLKREIEFLKQEFDIKEKNFKKQYANLERQFQQYKIQKEIEIQDLREENQQLKMHNILMSQKEEDNVKQDYQDLNSSALSNKIRELEMKLNFNDKFPQTPKTKKIHHNQKSKQKIELEQKTLQFLQPQSQQKSVQTPFLPSYEEFKIN